MESHSDGNLRLLHFGPLGPYDNNAYIVADDASREAVLIDMPSGSAEVVAAIEQENWRVKAILLTHSHPDHWGDYNLVRASIDAPVMAHAGETMISRDKIDASLEDGQEIRIGPFSLLPIYTPGHTPGSTCLLTGHYLMSGDVLFPGGPGRTQTPADFQRTIESIKTRLLTLPDDTVVFPGHGAGTNIAESKREFAGFEARKHPADLYGDVTWAG